MQDRKFYFSILILIFSIIFGQMVRIPVFEKIILVSDLAVLGFLIWRAISNNIALKNLFYQLKKNYLFRPIAAFISFAALSLVLAIPSLGAARVIESSLYLGRWIIYAAAAIAILSFPDKEKTKKSVFWGICASAFALSALGFIQLIIHPDFADMVKFGWDPHKNRLLSTWYDPNLLAGFFVIALAFLLARDKIQETRNKRQETSFIENWKLKVFVSCILYFSLILTYSRSGYLALAAVFIAICAVKFSRKFFVSGIIIAFLTLALFPRSWRRVSDAANIDVTSRMRIDSWRDTTEIIKKHPVFGVGFNSLQWRWNTSRSEHARSGSDSSLLTIWATTGILGLAAYIWIFWSILAHHLKILHSRLSSALDKTFALGAFSAIIGILVHSLFVNSLLYPHIMLAVWMAVL